MLMRRTVVAVRERCPLTRLSLARRRAAASDPAVECTGLDLVLDEADGSVDALADGPGDLRLHGNREVAPDVLKESSIRLRKIVRIGGQPLHRPLAGREDFAAVFEVGPAVDIGVDQILDRAIDRS